MMITESLRGITTPIVTPFDPETLAVDTTAYESLLEQLLSAEIDAVFPCGTTGEFASLTVDERRQLIATSCEVAGDDVPVIAGAAATSVAETIQRIDEAAEAGADAAAVVPPYFHPANHPDGNHQFFRAIADESALPLLLYNIPSCTGNPLDFETVSALADHDRVLGMKDSSGDFEYFLRVVRSVPDTFVLLQGFDALLVPSLRAGADGGVNALSNVIPSVLLEAFAEANSERGRRLQQDAISPLFEACSEYGFAPATKAGLLHRRHLPSDALRPPLVPVPDEGRAEIAAAVDRAVDI